MCILIFHKKFEQKSAHFTLQNMVYVVTFDLKVIHKVVVLFALIYWWEAEPQGLKHFAQST